MYKVEFDHTQEPIFMVTIVTIVCLALCYVMLVIVWTKFLVQHQPLRH